MSCSSPRKVISANRGTKRHFDRHYESLPSGREHRSGVSPYDFVQACLYVFTVREGEGT